MNSHALILVFVLFLSAFIPLSAQQSEPADGNSGETAEIPELEDVVVEDYAAIYSARETDSATRITAPLTEVPLSVQVIPKALIEDQGIIDVDEILKNVSGASSVDGFTTRPNFYAIRGFYNFNYRDGFRLPLDAYVSVNPFALSRVEVLKGPSSNLFGKGDPGGLVNFTSSRPRFDFGGVLQGTIGTDDYYRADLDVTGPLSENVAYRFVGTYEDAGSYCASGESERLHLNPSFTVNFGPKVSLWVNYERSELETVPDQGVLVLPSGALPPLRTREGFFGAPDDIYDVAQNRLIAHLSVEFAISGMRAFPTFLTRAWYPTV